jgi:hypothetical protein
MVPFCRRLAGALVLLAAACSNERVIETRGVEAPARPSDCSIDFITAGPHDVEPGGRYELLGYVTFFEDSIALPSQSDMQARVRGRACAMGGDAMTLWNVDGAGTAKAGHAEIDYAVLRRRDRASAL